MKVGKVCVAGLGQVGLPTASYVAEKGIRIVGYDIDKGKVKLAEGSGLQATSDWSEVPPSDAYIICVSTSWTNGHPDFSALEAIADRIQEHHRKGMLVSVESTVLPGALRKIFLPRLGTSDGLVHVPHRYWIGDPQHHGVRQVRVMGALDPSSLAAGRSFYETRLDIPLEIVDSLEVAEMSKIVENSHRFVQIAFAEEIRMICETSKLDFEALRRACNSKWNVDILEARDGIGGHCLPKDIEYLRHMAGVSNNLLSGAASADKAYRDSMKAEKPVLLPAEGRR